MRTAPLIALLSLPLVLLPACSGSGSGANGSADFLLTDAPVDDLLSFSVRVTELRLSKDSGSTTGNFLKSPITLEFLGLAGSNAWVATGSVPTGTYSAVLLRFDPASVSAHALDGSPVAVVVGSNELLATLPAPIEVLEDDNLRFTTDLDLSSSLSGDVSSGSIDFDPSGSSSSDDSLEAPIDEIKGVVTSFDAVAQTLVMSAYADGDLNVPLGSVTVAVDGSTQLIDDNNAAFVSTAAFFAFLMTGQTLLEVHGNLAQNSTINADRIEVEDQLGGTSGGDTLVRIEGVISSIDAPDRFHLLIQEIKQGASVAQPVLNTLGNPASIEVSHGEATLYLLDGDEPTTASSLGVGKEVKARFAVFSGEPFPAFEIEIDNSPGLVLGDVRDTSGWPELVGVELHSASAALWRANRGQTPELLQVSLAGADWGPTGVPQSGLLTGQTLVLQGSAAAGSNAFLASAVELQPARLVGARVTVVDPISGTFETLGGELQGVLGAFAGSFHWRIQPGQEALLLGLQAGQLRTISGLPTDWPGEGIASAID